MDTLGVAERLVALTASSRVRPIEAASLQNRLLMATTTWREMLDEPLPKMPAGDPGTQIQSFELQLVERLCREASRENARTVADRTWELVHGRPDDDAVKRRMVQCHEELVKLISD